MLGLGSMIIMFSYANNIDLKLALDFLGMIIEGFFHSIDSIEYDFLIDDWIGTV